MRASTDIASLPPAKMNRYLLAASPPDFFLFHNAAERLEGYMINRLGDLLSDSERSVDDTEEGPCGQEEDMDNDEAAMQGEYPGGRTPSASADCGLTRRLASLDLCVASPRASDLLDRPLPADAAPTSGTVNLAEESGHRTVGFEVPRANSFPSSRRARRLKKKVSFADEMGDRLATYCYIPRCGKTDYACEYTYDDPYFLLSSFSTRRPSYPTAAQSVTSPSHPVASFYQPTSQPTGVTQCVETVHTICGLGFDQPSSHFSSFLTRLDADAVCLENAKVEDSSVFCSVRVKNVAYDKRVTARVTYDNWRSHVDVAARYVPSGLSVPLYDTFAFQIDSPPAGTLQARGPRTAEFAIRFRSGGREHWDNNRGANYKIMWMPRQRYSRPA